MGAHSYLGLAAAGALAGNRLGKTPVTKKMGLAIGHSIGYLIAPHERQARQRAGQGRGAPAEITTTAIRYRPTV